MFGLVVFFGFLAAIIIVPQILRNQERQRLHDTIRASLAKGQPVPPYLWQALSWRRRVYTDDVGYDPNLYAAQPASAARPYSAEQARAAALDPTMAEPLAGDPRFVDPAPADPFATPQPSAPLFVGRSLVERDLRRGVVWLAIGLGLIAAGGAFYAGLYYDGGAPEVFSSFAALGAIPAFVGLTYLALWFFSRKSKV